MLDPVEFGKAMASIVKDATAPLLKRIEELEARQPEKGDEGRSVTVDDVAPLIAECVKEAVSKIPPPKNGLDADPIEVSDVVKELLGTDEIRTLVNLECVAYLKENPPAPGKQGDKGDSVTMADVSLVLDAAIATHLLELERRANDAITKAIDRIPEPKPGRDGIDLTEVSVDYDGERTITVKGRTGTVTKHVPIPLDRGYWLQGSKYEKGDVVTHNGTAFIAQRETAVEPSASASQDWRILARKGRDGDNGSVRKIEPSKPIRLTDGD